MSNPLHLELIYKGDANLSCYYAAKVVETVAEKYRGQLKWEKVFVLQKDGSKRFYELSIVLYGEEQVKKGLVYAPIPSIFINEQMVFDRIPSIEELDEVINSLVNGNS